MPDDPPDGSPNEPISETDYEAIEAAVAETARGRRFLAEHARRQRGSEMDRLSEAVERIERMIGMSAGVQSSPTVRLVIQRANEIERRLAMVAREMRAEGVQERFPLAVEQEARAVAALLRAPDEKQKRKATPASTAVGQDSEELSPREVRSPAEQAPPAVPETMRAAARVPVARSALAAGPGNLQDEDPRLAALSGLDQLSLSEKLALFA